MNKLVDMIIVAVFAGTFISCHDDPPAPPPEPTLPPITQTGENTFGCYVNGELWLPEGGWQSPALNADYYNNFVYISAVDVGQNPHTGFHLDFGKVFRDTSFDIHNYLDSAAYQYFVYNVGYSAPTVIFDYYPIALNSGEFNLLKLDTINRIIAGTFHFVAIDTLSGDSVRIEDGRFDLRY
jgi:hypothetical protein